MIRLEWKDCRLTAEGTQVVLENAALRTCWRLEPEGLALACVENRLTGFCWQSADGAALAPACMAPPDGEPEWEARPQAAGLCAEHWSVRCTWRQGTRSVSRCFCCIRKRRSSRYGPNGRLLRKGCLPLFGRQFPARQA